MEYPDPTPTNYDDALNEELIKFIQQNSVLEYLMNKELPQLIMHEDMVC